MRMTGIAIGLMGTGIILLMTLYAELCERI
jgi:hypothetical protein